MLGHVEPGDIQHAVLVVAAPATITSGLVDFQWVWVQIRSQKAAGWEYWRVAVLEGAEATDVVATIAVLVFAGVEHVVLVQVLPGANLADDGAGLPQVLTDVASMDLELVATFVAFHVHFIVIDAKLSKHLKLFLLILFQ